MAKLKDTAHCKFYLNLSIRFTIFKYIYIFGNGLGNTRTDFSTTAASSLTTLIENKTSNF